MGLLFPEKTVRNRHKVCPQALRPKKARAGIKKARGLLAKGDKQGFYDVVFETLQEYLGDKFHLPSKGITVNVIDDILKDEVIDKEALDKLKDIFRPAIWPVMPRRNPLKRIWR